MIQIHATKDGSKDLKQHLCTRGRSSGAMQWYVHRVTVLRRKCLILMEERSRYAMVFTGMVKGDFDEFPELFHDRLIREALSVCDLDEEASNKLIALADMICDEIQIVPGSNRSVQSHINEVARDLKILASRIGFLPEDEQGEFNFGLRVNQFLRKTKEDKEYFYPLDIFRAFWQGMIDEVELEKSNVLPFPASRRLH